MTESNQQTPSVLSVAISPKNDAYYQSLLWALTDLAQKDSTFTVEIEPSDGQINLLGFSESHLEGICDRIWDDYLIEIEVCVPQVLHLETIRKASEAEGKYIRQTGGLGNYGHCKIRIAPSEPGNGYKFINDVKGNVIPKQFIDGIDHGIREALSGGILAGYPVVDVIVTLYDGSYHDVDSNEMAYKIAGSMAFKEAARKAHPVLLEPVMAVTAQVAEEHVDVAIADLNYRRGRIEGVESREGFQIIHAIVPLSQMLISSKHGRAKYPMHFAGYEPVSRGKDFGGDEANVTSINPNLPIAGNRSAAIPLPTELD